jgi:hypothetical protein
VTSGPFDNGNGSDGLPFITGRVTVKGYKSKIKGTATGIGASSFRILEVAEPGDLTLIGTTITGGNVATSLTDRDGGGILNDGGELKLFRSEVTGNKASGDGGGIANEDGTVTLRSSKVENNTAQDGGGLSNNAAGTLALEDSTIRDNHASSGGNGDGGGISNKGDATIRASEITGNQADEDGGGINNNGGSLSLKNSKVINNRAGLTAGTRKDGGGINNGEDTKLNVSNSVFSGNTAIARGGAINNEGTAKIRKTNFFRNSANLGGAIYNEDPSDADTVPGHVTLRESDIIQNTATAIAGGGGIFNASGATVTLVRSQVKSNQPNNCSGSVPGC